MDAKELLDIIASGETSRVQFKEKIDNDNSIAAEIIAFSNSRGGVILIGVEDKEGRVVGLDYRQLQQYNNKLSTIATDRINPQVFLYTEVVTVPSESGEKKVLVVDVAEGINKPYKDNTGVIWIKQGSDKRKLVENNELLRLFQQTGLLHVDEMIVPQTSIDDVKFDRVVEYLKAIKKNGNDDEITVTETLLNNLNILRDGHLTLGGLLFFAKDPQRYQSTFCIKAVSFFGNSIGGTEYRCSQDIKGAIPQMYEEAIRFFTTNLCHVQAGQNFNSVGVLEVSQIALEEIIQNALVHRDYTKNAPVRIMIFDNRIEITSPGSLPNELTIENIKLGNAAVRNNLIVSYAAKLIKYRGFGSGIVRALENQPNIELENDDEVKQFKVIIPRPPKEW